MYTHRHVCVLAWSLCLRSHCWGDSWLFSPSAIRQKVGHSEVGKEAGILLVLPAVQLKARLESLLSLLCLSDSENFPAIAFFPVSNNPFVFTHFLPEMSCSLFAWQISLWTARESALCPFLWGLFHHLLPDLSIWNGFWLLLSSVVLALASPSVLSSSACGETCSSLRAVLGLCQPVARCGAASFLRWNEPGAQSRLSDYCAAWNWKMLLKLSLHSSLERTGCCVHRVYILTAVIWSWNCLCISALLTCLIHSKNCSVTNPRNSQAAPRQVNESIERSHSRNMLVVFWFSN